MPGEINRGPNSTTEPVDTGRQVSTQPQPEGQDAVEPSSSVPLRSDDDTSAVIARAEASHRTPTPKKKHGISSWLNPKAYFRAHFERQRKKLAANEYEILVRNLNRAGVKVTTLNEIVAKRYGHAGITDFEKLMSRTFEMSGGYNIRTRFIVELIERGEKDIVAALLKDGALTLGRLDGMSASQDDRVTEIGNALLKAGMKDLFQPLQTAYPEIEASAY